MSVEVKKNTVGLSRPLEYTKHSFRPIAAALFVIVVLIYHLLFKRHDGWRSKDLAEDLVEGSLAD